MSFVPSPRTFLVVKYSHVLLVSSFEIDLRKLNKKLSKLIIKFSKQATKPFS